MQRTAHGSRHNMRALPKRSHVVAGAVSGPLHCSLLKNCCPRPRIKLKRTSADLLGNEAIRFARMALPTRPSMPFRAPVGSAPFSGVNGAPLWNVKNELTCQPPSACPTKPFWSRKKGSSYTKLPESRCGRSKVDGARSALMSNEFWATATSPPDGLKRSEAVSRNLLQV